jgi:hypothetical protein
LLLLVTLAFIAAFAGVVFCTFFALRFAGRALARAEPRRGLMAGLAVVSALGVPLSAGLGFAAMAAAYVYASAVP